MLHFRQWRRNRNALRRAVLCYGDSNTWGTIPCGGRFPHEKCWCGVMERSLGDGWDVIREALPGRMERSRAWGFATGPERMASLRACLEKERNRREHDPRISILFAADFVTDNSEDGIHMTERSHASFGEAMASLLQQPA